MDTKLLEAFVALAEERQFSRAAHRLHLTQPAVSQQVKRLERRLGAELVERHARGVTLTPAGQRLLERARGVLADIAGLEATVSGEDSSLHGRLRIGYSGYHIANFLPDLLQLLQERHPSVRVSLFADLHGGLAPKAVLDGSVDFAFSRAMHHGDHVGSVVYAQDRVLIAVADDHPLAGNSSVTIDDVMDEPFITYPFARDSMVRNLVGSMAQNAGGLFSVRYAVADTPMILALVAAGLGVAQTFSSVQPLPVRGVTLLPLDGLEPLDNTIIWNRSRSSDPLHAAFIRIMREVLT